MPGYAGAYLLSGPEDEPWNEVEASEGSLSSSRRVLVVLVVVQLRVLVVLLVV